MANFRYRCSDTICGHVSFFINESYTAENELYHSGGRKCKKCEAPAIPWGRPATTKTVEVLDNGLMTKPVERLVNADDAWREWSNGGHGNDGQGNS